MVYDLAPGVLSIVYVVARATVVARYRPDKRIAAVRLVCRVCAVTL